MQFSNPVLPGFHPDPSVCRVGDDYYLVTSSFEYFPGIPLFHSKNLVDWEPIGHCLTRDDQLSLRNVESSEGVFAPTIRYHDGTFYVVTTSVGGGGQFVVTASDPHEEWSEPTWIDAPGFDPDLFWHDGETYYTYAHDHVVEQTTVDLDTGETEDSREIWTGTEGDFTEAPHIYEADGTYHLVVAEGGTHRGHMVVTARAEDPTGPFVGNPKNPVLSHRAEVFHPIEATGHADLVRARDGSWWLVCLGIRPHGDHPGYHHLGRETFLAPVTWDDGWPVVNDGQPLNLSMTVERDFDSDSEIGNRTWTETRDPFTNDKFGVEWQFRRNPERDRYRVEDGALVLLGGPETLDDPRPTFVGRRQQNFDCLTTATLAFDPDDGEEAGVAVTMDEDHHYDFGVTCRGDVRTAIVRLCIGDANEVVAESPLSNGPVQLRIEADREKYRFAVDSNDDSGLQSDDGPQSLATAETRYVSTEVAGGFTGVLLGPYATGHGTDCSTLARFESFAYRPTDE